MQTLPECYGNQLKLLFGKVPKTGAINNTETNST